MLNEKDITSTKKLNEIEKMIEAKIRMRRCLSNECTLPEPRHFLSESPSNRICPACKIKQNSKEFMFYKVWGDNLNE